MKTKTLKRLKKYARQACGYTSVVCRCSIGSVDRNMVVREAVKRGWKTSYTPHKLFRLPEDFNIIEFVNLNGRLRIFAYRQLESIDRPFFGVVENPTGQFTALLERLTDLSEKRTSLCMPDVETYKLKYDKGSDFVLATKSEFVEFEIPVEMLLAVFDNYLGNRSAAAVRYGDLRLSRTDAEQILCFVARKNIGTGKSFARVTPEDVVDLPASKPWLAFVGASEKYDEGKYSPFNLRTSPERGETQGVWYTANTHSRKDYPTNLKDFHNQWVYGPAVQGGMNAYAIDVRTPYARAAYPELVKALGY